mmetsp:Transcript_18818/g.61181  ORF Transcript_18818/g.61181 Transcript_18818/m.61181 type:complete len:195 (-) Transcript_18818:83-667(-)
MCTSQNNDCCAPEEATFVEEATCQDGYIPIRTGIGCSGFSNGLYKCCTHLGGAVIRAFSISNRAGVLADGGQNARNLLLIARHLHFSDMRILFGCGGSPSMPTSPKLPSPLASSAQGSILAGFALGGDGGPVDAAPTATAGGASALQLASSALFGALCTLLAVRGRELVGRRWAMGAPRGPISASGSVPLDCEE